MMFWRYKMFGIRKPKSETAYEYHPDQESPAVRSSICTGEKVAGFVNKETGRFQEVMLIRTAEDMAKFKRQFHLEETEIKHIY